MADQLLDLGTVYLTRFCGPASAGDRRCFQIDGPNQLHGKPQFLNVCLTRDQAETVARAILAELGFEVIEFVCLCLRHFPTQRDLKTHLEEKHQNWPPEQWSAVLDGSAVRKAVRS